MLRTFAIADSFVFLIGLIAAQWQMGASWRIGIDEENRTELVTTGFFRYMRNPVFTMILGDLGSITLALPCAATLLLRGMSFSGLYLQTLAEEKHLLRLHGEKYEQYKSQTGRFLPRFRDV
ncbi:MAG: methyltransferase family protein [bacterium]